MDEHTSPTLAIVTPSYSRDYELCEDLVSSVRHFGDDSVLQYIIVPRADMNRFRSIAGPRTIVQSVNEVLPRYFLQFPGNVWLNLRRPYPPVRGWIAQQLLKLSAVASLDVDVALLVDSDIVMVRPFSADTFMKHERPTLYVRPDAITHSNLPRHVVWHQVARRLLGLTDSTPRLLTDYISWPCVWEPWICRRLLEHLDRSTRGSWQSLVGAQLHFSEMILYGVYVEEILDRDHTRVPRVYDMRSIVYDREVPLSYNDIQQLLGQLKVDDIAIMVSAKSQTPIRTRRQAYRDWNYGNSR